MNHRRNIFMILLFLIFLVIPLTFAFLNRNCDAEGTIFRTFHVDRMNYYLGEKSKGYNLNPLWGYPLTLLLFKDYNKIIYFQALLWGIISFFLYLSIAQLLSYNKSKRLFLLFLITSFPIYGIVTTKWPASFQLMLIILSVFFLYRALISGKYIFASLAGFLLGIAGNFRSEYVYFSLFVIISYMLFYRVIEFRINRKVVIQLLLFVLFTWLALVPLGMERYNKTGQFNVLVGDGNWVTLFFSISQLPNNSLGLKALDASIETFLKNNLPKGSYDPNHIIQDQSITDKYSKIWFINFVKEHPFEYMKKLLNNLKFICAGGFFIGQVEKSLPESYYLSSVFIKELVKYIIGYQTNPPRLSLLYNNGFIISSKSVSLQDVSTLKIIRGLPFLIINFLFLSVNLIFLALLIYRFYILLAKNVKIALLEFILLSPILYGLILMVVGLYQPRFMSMLYFFIITTLVYWYDWLNGNKASG